MTTVAWDGETVAADSQIAASYIDPSGVNKLIKKRGKVYAMAGTYSQVYEYIINNKPITCEESCCLIIDLKTKQAMIQEIGGMYPVKPPVSIGSGSDFAITAMTLGKTAIEAVKIAIKLDPNSGGKVNSVKVK